MIKIKKRYYLREITIEINNRILTYDRILDRVVYIYKGINKKEYKLDYDKWDKVVSKYKLWNDYTFCKHEEISK